MSEENPCVETARSGADRTSAPVQPVSLEGPYFEVAYVHDGTLEGLLSAIFTAYARHESPTDIIAARQMQPRLGQCVLEVETNFDQAERVRRGITRICGQEAFELVARAALSDSPHAGSAAYRFVRHALKAPSPRRAAADITHSEVEPLVRIFRFVGNESHYLKQFLRFEQMEGGVWVARCAPKASAVPLVMDWFSRRFNTQPFIIYDEAHGLAGVYGGGDWYLVRTDTFETPPLAADDLTMQRAWKRFYDAVAVESRYNPELRRQNMPKRLWAHITEMQEQASPAPGSKDPPVVRNVSETEFGECGWPSGQRNLENSG